MKVSRETRRADNADGVLEPTNKNKFARAHKYTYYIINQLIKIKELTVLIKSKDSQLNHSLFLGKVDIFLQTRLFDAAHR